MDINGRQPLVRALKNNREKNMEEAARMTVK